MNISVLIVDDQPSNLDLLREALEPEHFEVLLANSGEAALQIARKAKPDVILLDIRMGAGMDGFETCRRLKADPATREAPVIFITASDEPGDVVRGFREGGVDYVLKPFREAEVRARLATHHRVAVLTKTLQAKNDELKRTIQQLKHEIETRETAEANLEAVQHRVEWLSEQEIEGWGLEEFVAGSPAMEPVIDLIRKLQPLPTSVLITGESGTGKDLVARAIHAGGPRQSKLFVALNCTAIPHDMAESELFGHVRGAFTGAVSDRAGAFENADGGTLFLDEIAELPLSIQPKLLRVLEDGRVQRLGAAVSRSFDVRIVAATNVDLEIRVREGRFRADLYHRLAAFRLEVPPLRKRLEDVPALVVALVRRLSLRARKTPPKVRPEFVKPLLSYPFPGNIRDLRNLVESALVQSDWKDLLPQHLPTRVREVPGNPAGAQPPEGVASTEGPFPTLKEAEWQHIQKALRLADGNISKAARALNITRSKLYRLLEEGGNATNEE